MNINGKNIRILNVQTKTRLIAINYGKSEINLAAGCDKRTELVYKWNVFNTDMNNFL